MTLFTANGILIADTRVSMRGIGRIPHSYIWMSYQDWLRTQEIPFEKSEGIHAWFDFLAVGCTGALFQKSAG